MQNLPRRLLPVFALLLLSVPSAIWAQSQDGGDTDPVFRSETRLVYTPFRVIDAHGEPVRDLRADEVRVFDNGVEQKASSFDNGSGAASIVLAVDTSASMQDGGDFLAIAKEGAKQFAKTRLSRAESDRLAVVTIGSRPVAIRLSEVPGPAGYFTSDPARIDAAIAALSSAGSTSIRDALAAASLQMLTGLDGVKTAIVLLTDGDDNSSVTDEASTENALARVGTIVFPIVVASDEPAKAGNRRSSGERFAKAMRAFSDATGGDLFEVTSSDELAAVYAKVADKLNYVYSVGYPMPEGPADLRHRIEIRVSRLGARALARQSYCPSSRCEGDPKTPEETVGRLREVAAAHPGFAIDRTQESALFPFGGLPEISGGAASSPSAAPTGPRDVAGCVCLDGRAFKIGDGLVRADTSNWRARIAKLTFLPSTARCMAELDTRELDLSGLGSSYYRLGEKDGNQPVAHLCTSRLEIPSPTAAATCHAGDVIFDRALTVGQVMETANGRCRVELYRIGETLGHASGKSARNRGETSLNWLDHPPTPQTEIIQTEAWLAPGELIPGLTVIDRRAK